MTTSPPTNALVLLDACDARGAASLGDEHRGLRASAFGRLPKSLLLDCWTYLDLDAHIAFTSAARWCRHLAVANPRLVSPRVLAVRSVDDDPGFERAVRRYHPRRLWCRPRGHNSFDWTAGCATTLTDLTLRSNEPTLCLAALESLTALTALDVEYTRANLAPQLSHVAGLTQLERLRLCGSAGHWNALQRLERLTALHLSAAASHDISVVARLPRLATLAFTSCGVALDLRPLVACRALTALSVEADGVDLTPIGACLGLTSLDFSNSIYAVDAAYVRPLVALRRLVLGRLVFGASGVKRLEALRDMRRLELLAVDGWPHASLDPLRDCTALGCLSIARSAPLADISALAGLRMLRHLRLRSAGLVHDLAPLAGLAGLVTADIGDLTSLVDIGPLAGLTALTALCLDGCDRVANLRPLAALTQLRALRLPERGRHPIDWSVLDRLTLLGAFFGGDLGAYRADSEWYRQPQWPMAPAGPLRWPPTHRSHPHPLVLGRTHFGHGCNWCAERAVGARARYGDELDTTYRCDACDYDLCVPCHRKLRVGPRPIPSSCDSVDAKMCVPSRGPDTVPTTETTLSMRDAWRRVFAAIVDPTRRSAT